MNHMLITKVIGMATLPLMVMVKLSVIKGVFSACNGNRRTVGLSIY